MQKILALLVAVVVVCPLRCPRVFEIVPERAESMSKGDAGQGRDRQAGILLFLRELDGSQLRISHLFSEWPLPSQQHLTRSNNIAKVHV